MQVKDHQGKTLRFLAVEPDGYDPSEGYPMVILLHGYGASMGDLAELCPAIDAEGYVYVCPNAPLPVRTGFGSLGCAWTTPGGGDTEEEGACAEEMLATLFEEAMSLYTTPPGQAVLGGFSQGGMMTYRAGLTNPDTFRGLIVLSSRVRDPDSLRDRLPATRTQPIFIAHGTGDSMIAVEEARESRGFLEAEGYVLDYREYAMGHEINEHVLADLVPWLHGVLPPARLEAGRR